MILIVDDDIGIRTSLTMMLRRARYEAEAAASPAECIAVVRQTAPQLILLDMNFSLTTTGDEGITLLKQIKLLRPEVSVILITAWGSIDLAVKGMRAGAFDFVTKPWNNVALMERIEVALDEALKTDDADKPKATKGAPGPFDTAGIVGRSPALRQVLDTVRRVAATNAPVLITGESGTGKELIAEAVHRNSRRAAGRFVKVNLGGMPQSLFESEMFGYRKGAFTGAVADRAGRFETADGGTIFLDEIGELDLASQVKLLRVLQDKTFEPLGESRPKQVNVRVVCATNADLPQMIREGRFREDLYYRINLITVHIPPLRERKEDIPLLARHFIERLCETDGLPAATLTDDAAAYLQGLDFPGNIRQLRNVVERALLVSGKEMITAADLRATADDLQTSAYTDSHGTATMLHAAASDTHSLNSGTDGGTSLEEMERRSIEQAMTEYDGNISRVAKALGLSRPALYRRLEKYKLK